MNDHRHSWEMIGEDDATGRRIVRCVSCGMYDWLDSVQLREKGLPADDPPAEFIVRPGAADPTSEALREAALLFERLINVIGAHPSIHVPLRNFMGLYDPLGEMEEVRTKCLAVWGKRSFANRIAKGEMP